MTSHDHFTSAQGSGPFEPPEQDYLAPEEAQELQLQIANKRSRAAGVWHRTGRVRSILIPVLALGLYSVAFWYGYNWYRSEPVEPDEAAVVATEGASSEESLIGEIGGNETHYQALSPRARQEPADDPTEAPLAAMPPQEARPASLAVEARTPTSKKGEEPDVVVKADGVPGPVVFEWQAPVAADTGGTASSPSPGEMESAAAAPNPPRDIPTDSGYVLQLAAIKDRSGTEPEWERFQSAFPDLLGDMKLSVEEALVGGKTYFRIQTGPFPTKATALDLCAQLKEKNQDCLVKKTRLQGTPVF